MPPTADRRPRALDLDLLHLIDSPSIIDTPNNADLPIQTTAIAMTATAALPRAAMTAAMSVVALCRPTAMTGRSSTIPPSAALPCRLKLSANQSSFTSAPAKSENASKEEDNSAVNPGSNLFVTGIHPRLEESEITRLFEKYGEVEKCQIMRDPHTGESRGFGFVKMMTSEQAEAAMEGLKGEVIEGRTLNIEKARRSRPRTPTPGKYFGPPKRGERLFFSSSAF